MSTHDITGPGTDEALEFYVTGEEHVHAGGGTMLGFWIYLMSDCLIFAVLFATYGVLGHNYAEGPSPKTLFNLTSVAINTAMLELEKGKVRNTLIWLVITGLFGCAFVGLELTEFAEFIREGAGPQRSAF